MGLSYFLKSLADGSLILTNAITFSSFFKIRILLQCRSNLGRYHASVLNLSLSSINFANTDLRSFQSSRNIPSSDLREIKVEMKLRYNWDRIRANNAEKLEQKEDQDSDEPMIRLTMKWVRNCVAKNENAWLCVSLWLYITLSVLSTLFLFCFERHICCSRD